jgi:hypothetical protein
MDGKEEEFIQWMIRASAIRRPDHLALFTAISAFGDSIPPFSLAKPRDSKKNAWPEQQIFENHDVPIRTTPIGSKLRYCAQVPIHRHDCASA